MVTGERDLRSSDLCGIVDNVRGEIKERSREGRRTRLSILDRPAPRAPRSLPHNNNIYGNYALRFDSFPRLDPSDRRRRAQNTLKENLPSLNRLLFTNDQPTYNGHKLFGRNILAS